MTTWTKDNRKKPKGSRCGYVSRSTGKPCQNYAMPNGRCRLHGGKAVPAPKGHKRALKHGLYTPGLLTGEKELVHLFLKSLGSIDEELVMVKIKLRRAWKAQRMWEEANQLDDVEIANEVEMSGDKHRRKLTRSLGSEKTNHYRLESVERTNALVYDQEGEPHINRKVKTVKKREDYSREIKTLTKLVGQLELRRKELLESEGLGKEDLVKQFRDYANGAVETLPGGEM